MKNREELLAIIQPLYAATPMHSIGVDFIVDFLMMHPSVALDCIRASNVFGQEIEMFKNIKDALSDLTRLADGYENDYVVFSEWYKQNLKS